ncbi:MAG: hypothetical protein EBX41_10760, partial [Chitinophagia bacterium]|nr:hypothetical protein [Chitinophagia bacterium]
LGYGYGNELNTQAALLQAATDGFINESHGNHTSGIATGTGYLTESKKLRGIAPKADFIYAGSDLSENKILDATRWIFEQAQAQGKPAVINYSFGGWGEPLDGTSMLDRGIDALVGPGKIVVVAMGNEGRNKQTIRKKLKANDTLNTVWQVPNYQYGITPIVDVWGERNKHFNLIVTISATDGTSGECTFILDSESDFQTDSFGLLAGKQKDTLGVYVYSKYATNGCPRITLVSSNKGIFSAIKLSLIPKDSGTFIINAPFVGLGNNNGTAGFEEGTNETTIRTPATAKLVIAVGSSDLRNNYINLYRQNIFVSAQPIGSVSAFSSRGPTYDGRTKPDIIAPGNVVFSSVSSYDKYVNSTTVSDSTVFEGRTYFYQAYSGTSMACPFVTGAVALMLQKLPNITPGIAKQI